MTLVTNIMGDFSEEKGRCRQGELEKRSSEPELRRWTELSWKKEGKCSWMWKNKRQNAQRQNNVLKSLIELGILGELTTLYFHHCSFKILEVTCPFQPCCLFGKRTEPVHTRNQLSTCVLCLGLPPAFPFSGQVLLPMGLLPSWMERLSTGLQDARNYEKFLEGSIPHCLLFRMASAYVQSPGEGSAFLWLLWSSMSSEDLRWRTLWAMNMVSSSIQASRIHHVQSSQPYR